LNSFEKKPAAASKMIAESELILNPDGSIYHLHLRPQDIADKVIVVGDPGRVKQVSAHFSSTEVKVSNREFVTHTGTFNGKRVTALSTGIGTDNIDIVLNELDALVNIDFQERAIRAERKKLEIVRVGTSGSLQADVPPDSFVVSSHGLGLDGLLNYYASLDDINENGLSTAFMEQTAWNSKLPFPYFIRGSSRLCARIGEGCISGITATAPGFYGPQGRELRLKPAIPDLNERLTAFSHGGLRITNFEMETSALYGLSMHLGHEASTVCAIIANRISRQYSRNYAAKVDELIRLVLERI
jgi:uridine phosphorylase